MAQLVHEGLAELWAVPVPVVAQLHGAAAGAGVGLVACADLVLAGRSARLVMAYSAIGLSPDCGTTWLLPRIIGLRRAMELTLTGRVLGAEEAVEWGLVTRVVDDGDLDASVRILTEDLVARPRQGLIASKRLLRNAFSNTLEAQLAQEAQAIAALAAQPEPAAARRAFLERASR